MLHVNESSQYVFKKKKKIFIPGLDSLVQVCLMSAGEVDAVPDFIRPSVFSCSPVHLQVCKSCSLYDSSVKIKCENKKNWHCAFGHSSKISVNRPAVTMVTSEMCRAQFLENWKLTLSFPLSVSVNHRQDRASRQPHAQTTKTKYIDPPKAPRINLDFHLNQLTV